jgi:hypothetical protein
MALYWHHSPILGTSFTVDLNALAVDIKRWGAELGFQQVGITDTDLSAYREK